LYDVSSTDTVIRTPGNRGLQKPYNYEQPSSSTGVMSPEPLKSLFHWSDDEE